MGILTIEGKVNPFLQFNVLKANKIDPFCYDVLKLSNIKLIPIAH